MTQPSAAYRPDIDGLRALSILAVLAFHAFPGRLTAGFVGVDVFFVISGYLIGGLVYSQVESGRFSYVTFYMRRIRRIFPALLIVLVGVYVAGWHVLHAAEYRQLGKHVAGGAGFVSNFVLLGEAGYFDAEASTKPLLHLWSLAIEEQFYLFFPLFAGALRRRSIFLWVTLGLSLLSFAANVGLPPGEAFYSPASRFWELGVGVMLSQARHAPALRFLMGRDGHRLRGLAVGAGLALIAAATVATPVQSFPGWWALLPVLGSALVILGGPDAWPSRTVLSWRPLVFVGLISYPLYLWHWPLFSFAWIIHGGQPPTITRVVLLGASFALAWLTYVLVERPIRAGAGLGRASSALATLVFLMGALGLLTMSRDGIGDRQVAVENRELAERVAEPTRTRLSDGSCERSYGIKMVGDEVCLVNGPSPRLLFMGDSLAMSMYSAIFTGDVREQAVLVATHSHNWDHPECAKPVDLKVWMQGKEPCESVVRNALEILRHAPSIKAVVLVSLNSNPFFLSAERVMSLQDEILSLGRKIVYAGVVPRFGRSPSECWPRRLSLFGREYGADGVHACVEARALLVHQQDGERRVFDAARQKNPGLLFYDPQPAFCDAQYCHQAEAQGVLFWRDAHVNVQGSARVLGDFYTWANRYVFSGE